MKLIARDLVSSWGSAEIDKSKILGHGATAVIHPAEFLGKYYAAKIYKEDRQFNTSKIRAMLANVPDNIEIQVGANRHPQFAWPTSILSDRTGKDVGYLMPLADLSKAFSLDYFYDQTLTKKLRSPAEAALSFKLEIGRNLTRLVADLHAHGHYFIDMKPQNIRVALGSHVVTLVDCDGFSIVGPDGIRYPADMVSADYIAPEATRNKTPRTKLGEEQDRYALAVILFQLLNRGTHPFQGILTHSGSTFSTNDEKAALGLYPHGVKQHAGISPRPQSIHFLLDDGLRSMFDGAFVGSVETRPSAREWANCLDLLLKGGALTRCGRHPSDLTHMRFVNKECPTCYLSGLATASVKSTRVNLSAAPQNGGSSGGPSVAVSPKPTTSSNGGWMWWTGVVFLAFMLITKCSEKPSSPPQVPTIATPVPVPAPNVSVQADIAAVEREVNAANRASDLPSVQDIQRRYPMFVTSAGWPFWEPLRAKLESKRISLSATANQSAPSKGNAARKSGGACSREVLASRSTSMLCSGSGTPRNTCFGSEVREELERRGVFEYEGGCAKYASPKAIAASPRPPSQTKEDVQANRSRYIEILKDIEALRPELNPDSPTHRKDLVDLAARRKQAYVRQGMAEHEALARAVADLEQQGVFRSPMGTGASGDVDAPKAVKPRVIDPGGHSGFPGNCRWVSPQQWSCN